MHAYICLSESGAWHVKSAMQFAMADNSDERSTYVPKLQLVSGSKDRKE